MSGDPQYTNIPLLAAFLKSFSRVYLGPRLQDGGEKAQSEESLPEGVQELVPVATQDKFREMFTTYFNGASKTLIKGQVVSLWCGLEVPGRSDLTPLSETARTG